MGQLKRQSFGTRVKARSVVWIRATRCLGTSPTIQQTSVLNFYITDGSPPSAFAFDVQSVVAAPYPALSSEQDYLVS